MSKVGEIVMVRPADVFIGERRRKEMGDVRELADDIRENGLYHPPLVRLPNETEQELGLDCPFILVAGGRRLGALIFLGWHEIPVYVRESMDELKHRIIELRENIMRKQLNWDEESRMMEEIVQIRQEMAEMEGKTITHFEVARELNINKGTLSRNLAVAEAIRQQPELKKASSRKAALRIRDMTRHGESLSVKELMANQAKSSTGGLQQAIVTADARDWLREVPSRSVDLILTDIPYAINYFSSGHKMRAGGKDQNIGVSEYDDTLDTTTDLLIDIVPQWTRVLRETGWLCVFTGEESYVIVSKLLINCCLEHFEYRRNFVLGSPNKQSSSECSAPNKSGPCRYVPPIQKPWIWWRPNSRNNPRYPELHAKNEYENILVCNMGKARLTGPCGNLLMYDAVYGDDRIHVHQKPVDLAKDLVTRFTLIGDTVLDSFFGSGALLAGALSTGRLILGCDNNPAMRGPALGFLSKHYTPSPARARENSEKRYLANREKTVVSEQQYEEVEA